MISRYIMFFCCFLLCLLLYFDVCNSQPLALNCPNKTVDDTNTTAAVTNHGNASYIYLYAQNLCRGDVRRIDCEKCLKTAVSEILRLCNQTTATIWYDLCMHSQSSQPIISTWDPSVGKQLINPANVTNEALFEQAVRELMDKTMVGAARDLSGTKFAVEKVDLPTSGTIYALAQCTSDLSYSDCVTCLGKAISLLPTYSRGARYLFPSCNIRYEMFPFYDLSFLHPQLAPSLQPTAPPEGKSPISVGVAIVISLSSVSSFVLLVISSVYLKRRSMKRRADKRQDAADVDDINIDPESLRYSLTVIELATNKFSADNKIGQGGFGGVYKGKLPNGENIAVKRLSRRSGQGVEEFKNEIGVVAKLQHKNLVRLLGFCLEGEEKILVYEFVPNRSLDYFLFDPEKQGLLNWPRRLDIIAGIARGLLYLHEDSRLKIVHRDLKAGNILLDESLHPKIADFGMARICRINQSEGNTTRIAGTVGYMAPEYTRSGQYSVKSDVFSFGIVVLEIITGKKNSTFYQSEDSEDLLSYAWRHWRDDTPLALLDPTIGDTYVKNEVIQNLHVGLLCVEEDADRRPTMASVVNMLNSTSVSLPTPFRPAIRGRGISECMLPDVGSDHANNKLVPESINEASITEPYPR